MRWFWIWRNEFQTYNNVTTIRRKVIKRFTLHIKKNIQKKGDGKKNSYHDTDKNNNNNNTASTKKTTTDTKIHCNVRVFSFQICGCKTCVGLKILTRSCSVYHCGCGLSKTIPCRLMVTSPRKSLRPNISECQTVNHSVRVSKLFNGMKYLSVSSNIGFSVCFRTFVFRLPFFDLSGSK